MNLPITTYREHPEHLATIESAVEEGFPAFLLQDPVWDAAWPSILELWPELQLFVLDQNSERPIGMVNSVALAWDGTEDDLPAGTHSALRQSIFDRANGVRQQTACAIQGVVDPRAKQRGLGKYLMEAFLTNAHRNGFRRFVSPIRPTKKQEYPRVPLSEYIEFRASDGSSLDPWISVQRLLGAEIVAVADDSLVIEGRVAEWEEWTGREFPESGEYLIAGGHGPLMVDLERDHGRYSESHVWVEYPSP